MGHMVDRKHRDLSEEDIQRIASTFEKYQNGILVNEEGYCAVATIDDIKEHDYILTPGRYVGIAPGPDPEEPFEEKMTRLTEELSELFKSSDELKIEIKDKLSKLGFPIE